MVHIRIEDLEEYAKINKLAWSAFDRWSSLFLTGYTEEEK